MSYIISLLLLLFFFIFALFYILGRAIDRIEEKIDRIGEP